MPRLIDDLRAQGRFKMPGFVPPESAEQWELYADSVAKLMAAEPDMPVIVVNNVADYYFELSERWVFRRDVPNIAPLYPTFWMEYRLHPAPHLEANRTAPKAVGILMFAVHSGEPSFAQLWAAASLGYAEPQLNVNARWLMTGELFLDFGTGHIYGPTCSSFWAIDQHGACLDSWYKALATEEYDNIVQHIQSLNHPALLAMSFMHCKNVTVVDNVVDKPLAKKYHAKTCQWPAKYKTLVIEPLKQILRTQGRSEEVGLKKALHICRGHFADYTEGGGLFGKYHGRYWMPAHIKGIKKGATPRREIEVKV